MISIHNHHILYLDTAHGPPGAPTPTPTPTSAPQQPSTPASAPACCAACACRQPPAGRREPVRGPHDEAVRRACLHPCPWPTASGPHDEVVRRACPHVLGPLLHGGDDITEDISAGGTAAEGTPSPARPRPDAWAPSSCYKVFKTIMGRDGSLCVPLVKSLPCGSALAQTPAGVVWPET